MTRTFIAIELDEAVKRHLDGIIRQMAQALPNVRWVDPVSGRGKPCHYTSGQALPNVRWVDPEGIHLTVAFLGELTDEQLAEAMEATEVAAQQIPPLKFRLTHVGTFGLPRQPRVIWVGIEESSGRLLQLHHVLSQELEQRGFAVEKRPFSPHLTLARLKAPLQPDELQRLQHLVAEKHFNASSPVQDVDRVSVMKSELSRTGAKYTCLRVYPFLGMKM